MLLNDLLLPLKVYHSSSTLDQIEIQSVEMDSRKVKEGSLFVCMEGIKYDGHDFAKEAEKNGAIAIIAEKKLDCDIPVVIVPNTVKALALIADRFYGNPSNELNVIGITGTNGKTTLTYLLNDIFTAYGHKTAIVGTINMKIGDEIYPLQNTTPDALFLHKNFRKMIEKNIDTVIMEVSSHALHMGRVYGIHFDTAVFTNLTQDHLDYHTSMEDYAHAKSLLFSQLGNDYKHISCAVVNIDDSYVDVMIQATSQPIIPYGFDQRAFIRADEIALSAEGSTFQVLTPNETFIINSNLPGKFNIYNMLAAIAVAFSYSIPMSTVKNALENTKGVPGRFESVDVGQDFSVIVDYAHTPDSLENILMSLVELKQNNIITVVGCGGDRDRSKRPKMADVAIQYSDLSIFTSDNPRTEDPEVILNDMTSHLTVDNYLVIQNRKDAIKQAIYRAAKNDIILIAGKGHETYQEIKGKRNHFDDREVAKEMIEKRLKE